MGKEKQKKQAKGGGLSDAQSFMLYAGVLLAARTVSVLYSVSTDCDETMNFYEPTHYLLHGTGLQTWEYSPHYALRSWFYLCIHAVGAIIARSVINPELGLPPKLVEFYGIRMEIAVLSSLSEAYLLLQARRLCGRSVALLGLCFLAFAPGMYAAGTAFLPSSFSMISLTAAYAGLLAGREFLPILAACVAVLVAWPFVGLAAVPLGLALVLRKGGNSSFAWHTFCLALKGVAALAVVVVPLLVVDSHFYGRPVLAPWQIVLYNVINQPEGGSALYGVEPWHFYVLNGVLNFNGAFLLALTSAVVFAVALATGAKKRKRTYLTSGPFWACAGAFYLWVGFMSLQAHKEERFIFVVYPLLCLLAAAALDLITRGLAKLCSFFRPAAAVLAVTAFAALSVSRIYAVQSGFSASQDAWLHLSETVLAGSEHSPANVCVGKEWYRFPSAFFLPSEKATLRFIRCNFTGELPQPFGEHPWDEPLQPFNDLNRLEPSRYVEVSECDYIVDQEFEGQAEPMYSRMDDQWAVVWSKDFLDAPKSPPLTRSFYIPGVSTTTNVYSKYLILKNKNRNTTSV